MSENFTRSYVITDLEAAIISKKAELMGNSSDSAALRAILREWSDLTSNIVNPTVSAETPANHG